MKRRLGALAAGAALLLAGCGGPPPAPKPPSVRVGSLGAPLALAPLALGPGNPPTVVATGPAARAAVFLVAPSTDLGPLAREGFTVIGGLCRTSPETLLWHGRTVFAWTDLAKGPLYLAPGADAATLALAVRRYRGVLDALPAAVPQTGGVAAFRKDPAALLLAPEPLASQLVAQGAATLAQPLADELGPYPTCLVYARRSVLRADPLLVGSLLRRLDRGLLEIAAERAERELPALRELAPSLPPTAWLRAMAAAHAEGIFAQTVLLDAQALRTLRQEIAPGAWPRGALDLGPARSAVRRPFAP